MEADNGGRRACTHAGELWGRWYIEAIDSPYRGGVNGHLRHVVELRGTESYAVYSVGEASGIRPKSWLVTRQSGIDVGRV